MQKRQTAELRKGRLSLPGARYFLTLCVVRPCGRLSEPVSREAVVGVINRLGCDGDLCVYCATIMPDHLHLLGALSDRLSLAQCVGKLKSLSRSALKAAGCLWQENFFEHRLRPEESTEPYGRYMFLNPYRASLIGASSEWSGWLLPDPTRFEFPEMLTEGKYPPREWIPQGLAEMGLTEEAVGRD